MARDPRGGEPDYIGQLNANNNLNPTERTFHCAPAGQQTEVTFVYSFVYSSVQCTGASSLSHHVQQSFQ